MKGNTTDRSLHQKFLDIASSNGLDQMVQEATWENNILDLK